jgi:hypothetical protein
MEQVFPLVQGLLAMEKKYSLNSAALAMVILQRV